MSFPMELRELIESLASKYKPTELKNSAEQLSEAYLNKERTGKSLANTEKDILAYSIMRMPATYSANSFALKESLSHIETEINTILDVGAGMGTASFAYYYSINKKASFTCLEREQEMINLGKKLMADFEGIKTTNWIQCDYTKELPEGNFDLVIVSYSLNELSKENREKIVDLLLKKTNKILLIVDSGTPESSKMLKEVREKMINDGVHILAPCPDCYKCPMEENDWCHFSTRVERSKLHKYIKGGDAPYEDEKFSYLAISKIQPINKCSYRVLRHPIVGKGNISFIVCSKDGIETKRLFKKDPLFAKAKKIKCGESL